MLNGHYLMISRNRYYSKVLSYLAHFLMVSGTTILDSVERRAIAHAVSTGDKRLMFTVDWVQNDFCAAMLPSLFYIPHGWY